ncbi:MAG TPA: toprim domain protein, partial [Mycobacterium sp.]|nr:toprim domain protein [Mycobacterium sp.]
MTDTAYDRIIGALRERGNHVIENGRGKAKAQCPAHDDTSPSLSVTAIEGRVLIHCHAGCEARDIAGALGLQMADLFDNRSGRDYRYPGGRKSHRRYRDDGTKRFWQTGDKTDRTLYGSQ